MLGTYCLLLALSATDDKAKALPEVPPPNSYLALDAPEPGLTHSLDLRHGEPSVPVRLMEGAQEVVFSPRGPMRAHLEGSAAKELDAPANTRFRARLRHGEPAEVATRIQLGDFPFVDKDGLTKEVSLWMARGLETETRVIGAVYGIAGKVIDNRRYLLLLPETLSPQQSKLKQAELLRAWGVRTTLFEDLKSPAHGQFELLDADGGSLGLAEDRITLETTDGSGFQIDRVEYGVGYDFHGFENRSYRGKLSILADRNGKLTLVNTVSLEDLLKGLVPSEIPARAHEEALKAQAVTARGEVLAKIGTKHLVDPYLLCSEQHCAVYKGLGGEASATNAAVETTRGQALFDAQGRLVDSVYSAVCGGYTENNENVWGGPPNPSLRGKADFLEHGSHPVPAHLEDFLSSPARAACDRSRLSSHSKYRWKRHFNLEEMNRLTADLGLGSIHALAVRERGVSGRVKLLFLGGDQGATEIRGELNIRRRLGMLNSALFLIQVETDARGQPLGWTFVGGGWGHGVGMCQAGAMGRAEAGQDYRAILRHYFNGAEVARIY